jgi:hemerythrin-like metal-binding protein
MEHHLVCESDPGAAAETLEQLLAFTRVHFDAEELLMRHHRYPGVAGHAAAHQRLLGEALAIGQAHGAGDAGTARATVARLRDWLLQHIEGEDAAFDQWCTRNGIALE